MNNNNDAAIALLEKHFDIAFAAPDGIKKLRELILSLAMQGKLVAQDPNDQPASELLREIEKEKQRLIKEGKIKKSKPLPEIKPNEIPYNLPKGWEWVRLGELGEVQTGTTPSTKDIENFGNFIPFIGPGDIKNYRIDYSGQGLSEIGIVKGRLIEKNSILMVCIGGSMGKHAINDRDITCNQQINTITPYNYESTRYIFFALGEKYFQMLVVNQSSGSATPIINKQKWSSIPVPLPPLAEQRRIVAKIDELMARCDELEKLRSDRDRKQITVHNSALNRLLIAKQHSEFNTAWQFITQHFSELYSVKENVTELRKAILQLAVMGKLVPQDPNDQPASELLKKIEKEKERLVKEGKIKKSKPLPEIKPDEVPYELPKGWEWCRWNDVALKIGDIDHKMPNETTDGVPYVSPRDFFGKNEINFSQAKKISVQDFEALKLKIQPQKFDIIFPRYGTLGVNRFVLVDIDFLASYSCAVIKNLQGFIDPQYSYYYSISKLVRTEIERYTKKTTQANVGVQSIQIFLYPLPPLAEQHRIVAKIDQLMALCDNLEKQIDNANSKQTNLLNAVMTKI